MVGLSGKLRLGVLVSGRGSNLQALIDACAEAAFPAEIALVISNIAGAYGLERASRAGIPTRVIAHKPFASRGDFEAAVTEALHEAGCGLICLAGFMRLLTGPFVEAWWDRLINIHPSLLPASPGLHTHERVLDCGARFSGCTVHFVRAAMDDGPIIVQAAVPVLADDDAARLAARILVQEHRIYPLAVKLIAEGRVRVDRARVRVEGAATPDAALVNPSS